MVWLPTRWTRVIDASLSHAIARRADDGIDDAPPQLVSPANESPPDGTAVSHESERATRKHVVDLFWHFSTEFRRIEE